MSNKRRVHDAKFKVNAGGVELRKFGTYGTGFDDDVIFPQGTTTTEITDRKFVSLDGLRCKYLVRKIVRTLSKPVVEPPRPTPTKSKRGRTLRPKIVLQPDDEHDTMVPTGPRIIEAWYPEVSNSNATHVHRISVSIASIKLGSQTSSSYPVSSFPLTSGRETIVLGKFRFEVQDCPGRGKFK